MNDTAAPIPHISFQRPDNSVYYLHRKEYFGQEPYENPDALASLHTPVALHTSPLGRCNNSTLHIADSPGESVTAIAYIIKELGITSSICDSIGCPENLLISPIGFWFNCGNSNLTYLGGSSELPFFIP